MDPMENIWDKASKAGKDGKRHLFFKGELDLNYLYITGLVDYKNYTLKSWIEAFKPSRQKDGSYIVSHDQWTEKKKFYYDGPVNPPYDPMTIPEREYTEAEFVDLMKEKILPNTIAGEDYGQEILKKMKRANRLVNGKAVVDREVKEVLARFIAQYPSPIRILELLVDEMRLEKSKALEGTAFASGMTNQQAIGSKLARLSKETKKEDVVFPDIPSVSLKDLKKKRPTSGRI